MRNPWVFACFPKCVRKMLRRVNISLKRGKIASRVNILLKLNTRGRHMYKSGVKLKSTYAAITTMKFYLTST